MAIDHTPGQQTRAGKIRPAMNRVRLALAVIAVSALAFEVFDFLAGSDSHQVPTDFRMPVVDPPIEPDRPDLIGRSVIGIGDRMSGISMFRSISRGIARQ